MSAGNVRKVIGQAISDLEYRDLLFSDPDKALEGMELTGDEIAFVKGFKREKFDAAITEMEERISRAGVGGLNPLNLKGFAAMVNCF